MTPQSITLSETPARRLAALDGRSASAGLTSHPPSLISHGVVLLAMASTASALATFFATSLATPPLVGIGAGLLFAGVAAGAHIRISQPARLPVRRVKRSRTTMAGTADLDTPLQHVKPEPDAQSPAESSRHVEPSDLALALLASLEPHSSALSSSSFEYAPGFDGYAARHADAIITPNAPTAPLADESEFERVDRLVKRLADNVNQLQAMRDAAPVATPLLPDEPVDTTSDQLLASINALKRANAAPPPSTFPETTLSWAHSSAPPESHYPQERAAILAALNTERIDVYLEPILDLTDQRPQHYEVSIALKTAEGYTIDLANAASDLSGTGLLPLIDQARIARAADLARRLADRGKTGAVFTGLVGETLDDAGFADTFANATLTVGAFPGQLVLTLPQAHVATFTTADWQTLGRLRQAGFGFALSDVTTLDMDFAGLAHHGFTFARLDAQTFLDGLPTSGGLVPPADICRHVAACGLILIVGGIVEDHQMARIFGFGVLFGQGQLFGGPRATKAAPVTLSASETVPSYANLQ